MQLSRNKTRKRRRFDRRGSAAVECAFVAPLLTLLVLGAIDVGQYANVYQKVSDASRAGARFAVRYETQNTSAVEAAVRTYLSDVSGGESSTLASTAQITIVDAAGNPAAPGTNPNGTPHNGTLRYVSVFGPLQNVPTQPDCSDAVASGMLRGASGVAA